MVCDMAGVFTERPRMPSILNALRQDAARLTASVFHVPPASGRKKTPGLRPAAESEQRALKNRRTPKI